MENNIFQRREIKFLVDARQRAILEQAFRGHMAPDPHGESTICNIYYDTPDYRLVRASMEKPIYKEKLRLRSYGTPGRETPSFIEIKKKYQGVVYKRRIDAPYMDAKDYLEGKKDLNRKSQIKAEIDAFLAEVQKCDRFIRVDNLSVKPTAVVEGETKFRYHYY